MSNPLKRLLQRPVIWLSTRFSSSPDRQQVFSSLSALHEAILAGRRQKGLVLPFAMEQSRFIIFSDQHKGGKDGADDFMAAESSYLAALRHYGEQQFTFINLGDCEELWECTPKKVLAANQVSLMAEARFLQEKKYFRIFGNHDLEWRYAVPRQQFLKPLFGRKLKVYEGLILQTSYREQTYHIFLTHGHQGDLRSDGNAFSKWFVAAIWTPVQRYFNVRMDTLSDSYDLADRHNSLMYEWSKNYQKTFLISGHTHKPVFASLDHIDRLTKQLEKAQSQGNSAEVHILQQALAARRAEYAGKQFVKTMARPSYFNTGCCCFSDGDITGIEIANGFIRLVKWKNDTRTVLEESPLYYLFDQTG
ncbi:metallophosphoesterase [Chitinophaga polysaccharea]|uniref:metallophosphoesterase n=1 Tax=Chitinophaga polysaccharea TaxID=1293035 RepID=UPI0014558920|nr:metallophosphoesterase [Chitinophaga polysaccharea]